ncbi:GNAT family N-acetyltransferase, partial [Streptomyces sp. ODS28]|uniref:GNAT family N-acetyltransferase n=1 Tax=Streptomyces sp. ODS28 TaxID=3136688 RepID=UPI0031EB2B06
MSLPAEHRVRDVHALLSDGTTARIRAAGPEDAGLVERFYARMSPDNLRLRFFSVGGSSAQQAARRLRAMDSAYSRTLVAEVAGRLVGIAEYVLPQAQRSQGASPSNVGAGADSREDGHEGERSTPPGDRAAEIALAVADAWHHRGIGTLLLEHLVDAARAAGITAFLADALSENHEMLKVFADLGLRTTRRFDGPEVHCTVRLEPDERYLEAVDARASAADVASMRPLLEPRSVAVVGAGREPGTPGHEVLKNLCAGGFTGILHAVNPKARAVAGVSCYPSVIALPSPPDLAVIAVPAHVVPDVAEECGEKGVR